MKVKTKTVISVTMNRHDVVMHEQVLREYLVLTDGAKMEHEIERREFAQKVLNTFKPLNTEK